MFAHNISLLQSAHNDFIGIILSSILAFLHFILLSFAEIIFYFNGSHEQFHIGYCVWNVSLLHPACKDFIGIIPSSILAFLHFILVSIAQIIFHFHGSHEQFYIGYCVWNVSLLQPARKDLIGIIPSSILAFLHFILMSITEIIFHFQGIHEQFHIGYCVWNVSLLHPACKDFIGIIPSSILVFLHFMLVSIAEIIFRSHGSHEQFDIGYCVWNVSLLQPARKDLIGIIPSSILAFLHFILMSITEIIFHFQGIHEQFHIGYWIWNVSLLHVANKDFIGIIPSSIPAFLYFILVSIA